MKITLLRIISVVATAAAQQKTAIAQKSARSFPKTGKIALLLSISAAILSALPNAEAAASKKNRTLVEVLPFEPSVEGIGFWLLDKALEEIGNETWAEVKQSVKDSWAEEIDPYKDDWASNKALEPYWEIGQYNLTLNKDDLTVVVSYQGREHLDSSAEGHLFVWDSNNQRTLTTLKGAAAAQYIDAEGMNLDGSYRKYQYSVRGFGDWNNDGVKTWSRWFPDVSGNEWSWIGHGSFDKAAARAEVRGWNTAERQYDLSYLIHGVDETWSVGSFYFNTVLTMDTRVHPNVVQHDGNYIVTITGEYTDVEYACCDSDGTGSANDVGDPREIYEEHTCQFNQSHLVVQHGIRFTLGDNQRVIDMDAKGAAERRAVKHDVKGRFKKLRMIGFESQFPNREWDLDMYEFHTWPGMTNRVVMEKTYYKEKVSEEYQIEEKKFHQPGQTNNVPSTTE